MIPEGNPSHSSPPRNITTVKSTPKYLRRNHLPLWLDNPLNEETETRNRNHQILSVIELTSKIQDKYQWIVAQRSTLSTYNPWALLSRLQMVIPPQSLDNVNKLLVTASRSKCVRDFSCRSSYCLGAAWGRCIASTDADLEAFNRNPAGGSFAALIFQLAVFTTYLNEVFLSYWLRLLSQY